MKPVVGIPIFCHERQPYPTYELRAHYLQAIARCGGSVRLIPVGSWFTQQDYLQQLQEITGLLLPGGGDPDARLFHEAPHPSVTRPNHLRDKGEVLVFQLAQQAGLPVLGICRGMQIINIALGGTLYQDIPSQFSGAHCHYQEDDIRSEPLHRVSLALTSRIGAGMRGYRFMVNSFHHQGIKTVAPGLQAAGWSDDGLIEAIEAPCEPILGVQWHPEYLFPYEPEQLRLFQFFLSLC